jgi:glycosyltransferase involved in cell wall biosynthesis
LGAPYDITVHDFHAICPQVNFLPWPEGFFCGEPGPATCNACIAARPSFGATDIQSWRMRQAWPFRGAERVICPSQSVLDRLARFGLATRAIVRPHEPVEPGVWRVDPPPLESDKMRIAVIGVLANHKGAHAVASVLAAMNPDTTEIRLIGHTSNNFPPEWRPLLRETGKYDHKDLPRLLDEYRPHIAWFPVPAPETYSYTLTAAMNAGVAIVASDIGAFPERLAGRPMSWLAPAQATAAQWLGVFDEIRTALRARDAMPISAPRPGIPDFHRMDYLSFAAEGAAPSPAAQRKKTDLRGSGRIGVVIIPERLEGDILSPCAYIRLLLPLNHPIIGEHLNIVLADAESALDYVADIFVTQRHAIPGVREADALAAHVNARGAALVYDLDDNLLEIPDDHEEAELLKPMACVVRQMLRHAHAVWVSTPVLAEALPRIEGRMKIIENGVDERLWCAGPRGVRHDFEPVRILYMGTATHGAGLDMISEALARVARDFTARVQIDIVGVTRGARLPEWLGRPKISASATRSYPGFVHWLKKQSPWDIGLAPLPDTPFNKAKSAIKTLDYAALGLAVLASDTPTYRDALANGDRGQLVANTTEAWYAAISALVRDAERRRTMADRTRASLMARGTLASQAERRRQAILDVVAGKGLGGTPKTPPA